MDKINEIFNKLQYNQINIEQARNMMREFFNSRPQPVKGEINLGGKPEQWVTRTEYQIREEQEMRYQLSRYQDFWEWFEDEYGETEKEVWEKFERFEDERDGVKENELVS